MGSSSRKPEPGRAIPDPRAPEPDTAAHVEEAGVEGTEGEAMREPLQCEFCDQPDGDPPSMLDVCPTCWNRANEGSGWMQRALTAEAQIRTLTAEREGEPQVRQTLWLNHGCSVVGLYGDDGEMQCNAASCRLDFKRDPLPRIILNLFGSGRLHAGELPPLAALAPALRTLRALVTQWRTEAAADQRVSFCADALERVLQALPPEAP